MPKLKVKVVEIERECNDDIPRITIQPLHDFNMLRFMQNVKSKDYEFELVGKRKEETNHEEDAFEYMNQLIDKRKLNYEPFDFTFLGQMFFPIPPKFKDMLIINKNKKYVLLKLCGEEYRVNCHEDDKFNWFIGFGLALSKSFGNNKKWKNAREYFRNPKTHKLDYKNYAQWCVFEHYCNDLSQVKELQNKVKEINEYGKVDL